MKILKEEKGSITLFVLIAMLFFVMYLVGMFILSANTESSQIEETAKIKAIYEQGVDNIDDVYNTLEKASKTKVNAPQLGGGMTPVKWNGTEFTETTSYDSEWYDYKDTSVTGQDTSTWANVKTKDESMWVWIPRYAYKITYNDSSDKSAGGTIDVVFLKGNTNYDFNGKDVTSATYVDENGTVGAYIVHPAFQDGTENGFANGEWDDELTGFWVAKFEAGYDGTAGDSTTATDSNVTLSTIYSWMNGNTNTDLTTNYYGTRVVGDTIKYPVFKANRPSMNYLGIADAYDLLRSLTSSGNPYGLTNSIDSHMMKNSEWGAVAYLTHSKYGRNGNEATINNVSANNENTIYAVTGYGGSTVSAGTDTSRTLTTLLTEGQSGSWTTTQGQTASSTGNIYGIYDLSGGLWEWTAGYVATEESYGGTLKGESSKYKSKYAGTSSTETTNYSTSPNPTRLGEAIWETSTAGSGATSWNRDGSYFWSTTASFSIRGGGWYNTTGVGVCLHSLGTTGTAITTSASVQY